MKGSTIVLCCLGFLLVSGSNGVVMNVFAGTVEWDFKTANNDLPVPPTIFTLAGTAADWTLSPNPLNVDPSIRAADVSQGYLHFLDDATISGNVSLLTEKKPDLRPQYALTKAGAQLWIVCDHKMIAYGHRANLQPGTVNSSRGQIFFFTFLTSKGTPLSIAYNAANYNTEDTLYYTAIGNAELTQDNYISDGYNIELDTQPNLDRRVVTLRITENEDNSTVKVEAKYDTGTYIVINDAYNLAITQYAAGDVAGAEDHLAGIGNNSGSGAIEFEMYHLTITNENPDGSPVSAWFLYN